MNENKFSVSYKKHADGYKIIAKCGSMKYVSFKGSETSALHVCAFLKALYDQGRYDEFQDNNKKCKSLMKKFAL